MGKSQQVAQARGANTREHKVQDHEESYEREWHVDRLATPVLGGIAAGSLPIHSSIHISVRVLHGSRSPQRTGKYLEASIIIDKHFSISRLNSLVTYNLQVECTLHRFLCCNNFKISSLFLVRSSSISRLNLRPRSRISLGKSNGPRRPIVAISRIRWTLPRSAESHCSRIFSREAKQICIINGSSRFLGRPTDNDRRCGS